jgi:UDP-glucose-4-epimerase GalE
MTGGTLPGRAPERDTKPDGSVLVTGGAGYIGSQTVHVLRRAGQRVVVIDRREPANADVIAGAVFVLGDIGDRQLVERVIRENAVESVVHVAGDKDVGESMARPERYFQNNVGGSLALLTAMATLGVRRLVFSSSCAVYGTPASLPVTETNPIHPENPYAETKAMVERMLAWFDRCHDIRSLSLRYFNAGGADPGGSIGEDWDRSVNLIPVVMKAALGVIPAVEIFGTDYPTPDGTAIRDYIHVLDLADAHVRSLEYLAKGGATDAVNLGTGRGTSVREIIDLVAEIGGLGVAVRDAPRRSGDAVAIYANGRKARAVLGWEPRFGAREIVETAWRWHSRRPPAS